MEYEKVNIGLLIEKRFNEYGINKTEFARRTGIAATNIDRSVFEREGINTDKLVEISKALEFDFFSYYKPVYHGVQDGGDLIGAGSLESYKMPSAEFYRKLNLKDKQIAEYFEMIKMKDRQINSLLDMVKEKDAKINELTKRINEDGEQLRNGGCYVVTDE